MKIVTPLTDIDGYIELVQAGADEFFCGFVPFEWLKKNNNSIPMNRRENLLNCNMSTFSSLKILRKMIEKYGIEVKITLNSLYYNEEDYGIILNTIHKLKDLGFKTFIIADLALIIFLRNHGIDCTIHLSGENSEINHWSINFFERYDISRFIFTRKNTVDQIKSCIANCNKKNIEFEAFILNELCAFSGAYCNSLHADDLPHACHIPYLRKKIDRNTAKFQMVERIHKFANQKVITPMNETNMEKKITAEKYIFGMSGCGICTIKQLTDAGITHFKVVGRGKQLNELVQDVRNLKACLELALEEKSDLEYRQIIKDKYFEGQCRGICYYP